MDLCSQSANALTFDEIQGLTYLQVKGSGIANTCPVLESGTTNLKELKAGSYKLENFCIEPTSFTVKEESQFKGGETEFVKTKLMTRLTYTLDAVSARDMNVIVHGSVGEACWHRSRCSCWVATDDRSRFFACRCPARSRSALTAPLS